uniref:Transmembrane protein 45B-like n=1 Tax=Saccoglossus kowalevskii TaxID=10224 RepID=A0ABM0LYA2_SACKO|nr:PREDICTED: transmembrane protein 45B-like [Saccoglossus kowalevskii]
MGHALLGSFFIVFGVWWCIKYSYRFIQWQHCTMHIFFGIAGAVFVIARTCVTGLKAFEHFFMALAFVIKGMLFYFHVHARSPLDISLHYMLVITNLMFVTMAFCRNILACMAVMDGIFGVISVHCRVTITQASTNEIRLECYDKLIDEI